MGNRVKGKTKKKSIKAAAHSGMGSKRKLSRMGKKQKRDHSGLDATFIGRSACLKRLQVTLKDFRRLCILKGIYPREPLGRVPKNKKGQTFYHVKDIKAIAHEPVLEKFREFRAFMKKIRRAAGRNERDEAARKNALVPTYTLHHLVKERYPRFVDALSDLDDALTLVYLFAALPSEKTIKAKVTNKAKSLAAAWGAYCATTFSITKSFISVKGVYLEASILGTTIRWIVPHSFTQFLPEDVDYKVMQTFFEFYETLLDFVLYKLYNDIGVRYPLPLADLGKMAAGSKSAILGSNLQALKNALNSSSGAIGDTVSKLVQGGAAGAKDDKHETTSSSTSKPNNKSSKDLIKSVGDVLSKVEEPEDDSDNSGDEGEDDDNVDVVGPLKVALESMAEEEDRHAVPGATGVETELDDEAVKRKHLFAGLTFFLSREIPRGYLELVCLAYGGSVGWEGDDSPISAKDPKITHHIVDRPCLPSSYNSLPKSREFVQPQWIVDCANFMFILPVSKYAVGKTLPPHLSPWVDDEEEGYKPAYAEEIERLKNGESVEDMEADDDAFVEQLKSKNKQSGDSGSESDDDDGQKEDIDEMPKEEDDDDDEVEEESDEDEQDKKAAVDRQKKKRKKEEDETHELAKVMMSRKASRLYGRMQRGIAQKKANVEILHKRRKELDRSKEKAGPESKTVLKQKVERLKDERKEVEATYSKTGGSMKKSKKKKSSS